MFILVTIMIIVILVTIIFITIIVIIITNIVITLIMAAFVDKGALAAPDKWDIVREQYDEITSIFIIICNTTILIHY